eukprot:378503-Pyramimonas_sp.AAC.1
MFYLLLSRPLPRGGLGGAAFLGATGETDGTFNFALYCTTTRARNLKPRRLSMGGGRASSRKEVTKMTTLPANS